MRAVRAHHGRMKAAATSLFLLAMTGCASHPAAIGPHPIINEPTRSLGRNVRVLMRSGDPMFVVDEDLWMWRDGRWLRWNDDGWRSAKPPEILHTLPRQETGLI